IFLTMHGEEDLFHAAMDLGANGYILKDSVVFDIVNGIKAVAEGQFYVTASLTSFLLQRRKAAKHFAAQTPSIELLTTTERRILQLTEITQRLESLAKKGVDRGSAGKISRA